MRKTHVGGQALLEGIMMRGKYNWSVAVREPSGAVYTEEHDLASGKEKNVAVSARRLRRRMMSRFRRDSKEDAVERHCVQ